MKVKTTASLKRIDWTNSVCDTGAYCLYLSKLQEAGLSTDYFLCYYPVIQDLVDRGVTEIVDIGCGSGVQGYLFNAFGIRYVGIEGEESNLLLGEVGEKGDPVVVRKAFYPVSIPEMEGITTAVSMYALGSKSLWKYMPKQFLSIRKQFRLFYLATFKFPQWLASLFLKLKEWYQDDCEGVKGSPNLAIYGC